MQAFILFFFLLFILFFMFAFSDSFGLRIINNPSNSSYHNYTESDKMLASGEISHLLSGENDQSQSDRNNQCISFSFL